MQLSDEEIEALAQLGVTQDELDALRDREADYTAIRHNPNTPQGRSAGQVYMAANPLEFVGDAIQRYRAGRKLEGVRGEMETARGTQADTRRDMMRALLRGQQQPPMQSSLPGQPQHSPVPAPNYLPAPPAGAPQQAAAPMQAGGPVLPYGAGPVRPTGGPMPPRNAMLAAALRG